MLTTLGPVDNMISEGIKHRFNLAYWRNFVNIANNTKIVGNWKGANLHISN
jgi:hypothetical protein